MTSRGIGYACIRKELLGMFVNSLTKGDASQRLWKVAVEVPTLEVGEHFIQARFV